MQREFRFDSYPWFGLSFDANNFFMQQGPGILAPMPIAPLAAPNEQQTFLFHTSHPSMIIGDCICRSSAR